jgi:hypothetical protein
MSKNQLIWKRKPEKEDYAGALAFLSLIMPQEKSKKLIHVMHKASVTEFAAKDLLRAANLPLLAREEPHVDADLKKIRHGKPLPPVLLIRGNVSEHIPLIVADGYHRICAICYYDESAPISCRMVDGVAD